MITDGRRSAALPGLARFAERPLWRDALRRRMLAVADLAAALGAAAAIWAAAGPTAGLIAALAAPGWLVLAKLHGLYDRDHKQLRHLTVDEIRSLVAWTAVAVAVTAALLLATPEGGPGAAGLLAAWLAAALTAFVLRAAARAAWRRVTPPEAAVVLGVGPGADAIVRKLDLFPDIHVRAVRHLDEPAAVLALPDALAGIDRVVVAGATLDEALLSQLLPLCRQRRVKLSVVPPVRRLLGAAAHLSHLAELPVLEYNTWDPPRSTLLLKRALDTAVAASALAAASPLLLVVALAVKLGSRGPVLFAQRRAGQGGQPFTMYKFRTMTRDAESRLSEVVSLDALDSPVFKEEADPRVTRVGRALRRWSLDELPQLVNVLRGEMSLVGPRPEQVEVAAVYRPEHEFRLTVKPGMTGPMQVYGRGDLSFEERLAVERDYIENLSLARDLRLLALTLSAVARGGGAY